MRNLAALAAAAAMTAIAAPAFAEGVADFQVYSLGDFTLNGNNISHRIAVGGDASFTGTSISGKTGANPASLVVGGDLTHSGGWVDQGIAGGTVNAPGYMMLTGGQTLPIDFAAENLRLKNLSTALAGFDTTGTAARQWSTMVFDGLNAASNVFTVSAADLAAVTGISFTNIASGSSILINVTGASATLGGGFSTPTNNVLWNFADATSLTAGGIGWGGSVLAPNAAFQGNSGSISGKLVVGSFNGAMSFGDGAYGGNYFSYAPPVVTPPTTGPVSGAIPEPGVWIMMILGFGGAGAMFRRRRALGVAAL